VDAWELQYFGALGQNPGSTADPDGQPLLVENAFGLNPLVSNLGLSVLPHLVRSGPVSPLALGYAIPVAQLADFTFIPQATDNLLSNWFGADAWPQYFLINSYLTNGAADVFSVQPNLTNWPGGTNQFFLRLQINGK
jgi:hypothetical protein